MTAMFKRKDGEARQKDPHIKDSLYINSLFTEFGDCEDMDIFLEKYICLVSTQLIEQSVKTNNGFMPEPIITLTQLRQFMEQHKFVFKK